MENNNNTEYISEDDIERASSGFINSSYEWFESIAQSLVFIITIFVFLFRIATVEGDSMYETLHNKDKVFILKWGYTPKDGDVVVITRGENYNKPLIKRVIATEGQTLKIDYNNNSVIVDGKTLSEPYILEPMRRKGDNTIPDVIPKGHTFVMGDNRNGSADSRYKEIGIIPNDRIVGKATHIILPISRIRKIV